MHCVKRRVTMRTIAVAIAVGLALPASAADVQFRVPACENCSTVRACVHDAFLAQQFETLVTFMDALGDAKDRVGFAAVADHVMNDPEPATHRPIVDTAVEGIANCYAKEQ